MMIFSQAGIPAQVLHPTPMGRQLRQRRLCAGKLSSINLAGEKTRIPVVLKRSSPGGTPRNSSSRGLHCRAELLEAIAAPTTAAAVYGTALLGGGLFAFSRTGSKGSLGGGVTGGVALALAYFLLQDPETRATGNAVGLGAALLFALVFGVRLAATRKAVPSGILLGISFLATIIFANAYFQA